MDQNQDIDNDLQKAIDDITNTEVSEPVFADPVAAPSSVPEVSDAQKPVVSFEETPIDTDASLDSVPELGVPPMPVENDSMSPMPNFSTETADPVAAESHGNNDIRDEALRELIPLLDKMDGISPNKKFDLCKMAFEDFHDPIMLEQAFKAAKEIPDENSRGQALLYVVEAR